MAKLTLTEIATIKELLDTQGELPHSFQNRLFPSEQSTAHGDAIDVQRVTDYLTDALSQQAGNDEDVDVAALAQGDEIYIWRTPRLWILAQSLSTEFVPVERLLVHFDTARWFGDDEPKTVRAVVEHARRIVTTDLSYTIILSAEGRILDGMHRVAKAWISDMETIAAVRFTTNPEPDFRIPRA